MAAAFAFSESIFGFLAQATPKPAPSTFESFLPLILVAATLVIALVLANAIAKGLRLPELATRITIILTALAISVLVIATGWPPRFGVDLRGGINYVGQLDLAAFQNKADRMAGISPPSAKDIIPNLIRRVDPSGTREILIRALDDDKIEVIMPQVDMAEADEVWNRLVRTGHLQFRILADRLFHNTDMELAVRQAESGNRSRNVYRTVGSAEPQLAAGWYDLGREEFNGKFGIGPEFKIKETPTLNNLVRNRENGQLINMAEVPMRAGADPGEAFARWLDLKGIRYPQVLLIEPKTDRFNVEGEHLSGVGSSYDQTGRPCITFALNGEGAKRMLSLTSAHQPQGNDKYRLAIVLDDALQSAPTINGPIGARGQIEGRFSDREINEMKVILDSGKISVALVKTPISKQYLESTLGAELKSQGLIAIGVSLAVVLLFMLYYYRSFAGTVACIALLLNLLMTIAVIMAIKQPLTLTGLAGLVLTIGMSVDANVLIFERIREELSRGSSLRVATQNGFERAFGTIVDSNLTTLLTAVVLYVLGTDQIKGFAVTLIVGILISMFTAVYVSRTIFEIFEKKQWIKSINMRNLFPTFDWDFMKKFWATTTASLVIIAAGLVAMLTLGSRILDIDLRGGSTAQISFVQSVQRAEIEKDLAGAAIKHDGEPVDFVVSELRSADGSKGREFKIDSSIPSYDPTKGDKWPELDQVLSSVFGKRLEQRRVSWNPESVVVTPAGTSPESAPAVTPAVTPAITPPAGGVGQSSSPDGNLKLSAIPAPAREALAGGLLTMQDTPPGSAPQEQPEVSVAAASANANPATAEGAVAPPTQTPEGAAGSVTANDPAATPQVPATTPSADAAGSAATDPNATGAAAAPAAVPGQVYSAKVSLTFDHPISAKSIRTQLVEASIRKDRQIEESQIRLSSPEVQGDELENLSLKSWDVVMETNNRDDASAILSDWTTQFNSLPWFKTASGVGSQIAENTQTKAFIAILVCLVGIIVYIWLRFQNLAFGIAAVVALIHDVLVVLGAIALSHYLAGALGFLMVEKFKISLQIVAALLTVIGYSLNDTIVIFDRIREIRGKRLELTSEMVNQSVSRTLSRTILTSLTTLLVVVLLYFMGGPAIHGFAFSLLVGVVAGTYSTIFIASPILVWLMNRAGLNAELNAELAAAARK